MEPTAAGSVLVAPGAPPIVAGSMGCLRFPRVASGAPPIVAGKHIIAPHPVVRTDVHPLPNVPQLRFLILSVPQHPNKLLGTVVASCTRLQPHKHHPYFTANTVRTLAQNIKLGRVCTIRDYHPDTQGTICRFPHLRTGHEHARHDQSC